MKGVVLYEGPSVLTGDPIVAIATFNSSNQKIGNMIQTWIIRSDMSPLEASKQRADDAVCGNCPLRRSLNGACYVNIGQAPQNIWRAYQRDLYPHYSEQKHAHYFRNRRLRLGAYGDPAAVPYDVWADVIRLAEFHTGYTHQRQHRNFDPRLTGICMVSVHTAPEARRAHRDGLSTFRVKRADEPGFAGEIKCPADFATVTCASCMKCSGGYTPNVVIDVHGPLNARF